MMSDRPRAVDCPHSERHDLAVAFLAGRLAPAEARAFEEHTFACRACWSEVEGALELRAAWAQLDDRTVPVTGSG